LVKEIKMKKQILVAGMGRFGLAIASTLHDLGHEVLAVDNDEKEVQAAARLVTHAVQADMTSEDTLRELGAKNFDVAIVAIGTGVESSVLSTLLLKSIGIPYVVARANNTLHGRILERIGADRVVYPEQDMAYSIAHEVTMAEVSEYMPVAAGYGVSKLAAPEYIVGARLSDIGFDKRERLGLATLLIRRGEEVIVFPDPEETVQTGDILIIGGEADNLERLLTEAKRRQGGQQ
jgi:trk system potassium uptake protein